MHRLPLRDLRARFPGWQFWVVPRGRDGDATWCARPWPLINASSPEELAGHIRAAHSLSPDGSPALASWRSYTSRTARLRGYKEAAAAAWRRMRAAMDARRRVPRFPEIRRRPDQAEPPTPPPPAEPGLPDAIA